MPPRKSFPLDLPLDILAQFLFPDEARSRWSVGAPVGTDAARPAGDGCAGQALRCSGPLTCREPDGVGVTKAEAGVQCLARGRLERPAEAQVSRAAVPEPASWGQALAGSTPVP